MKTIYDLRITIYELRIMNNSRHEIEIVNRKPKS